jgi:GT2 family glycosyltransferase
LGIDLSALKTAVVILNWNGRRFLEKFLPGVIEHSADVAEIIIADNDSSDDSLEYLGKSHPGLRIIKLEKNFGFAGGYNQALKEIEADYYILLNSDIEVTDNWISPVIGIMQNDTSIAACQPKIRSYNDPEKFEYAGAAGGFIDKYGYPFCQGRLFQSLEKDEGQYNLTREVFWATGACMFVRSDVFSKLGGFDDEFFAHMEEIDFCWRAKNQGYKIMYCPDSTIFHIGGGTLPKNNSRKTYLNIRNNIIMLFKNLEQERLTRVLTARIILDYIAAMKFLVDGGFKDMIAVLKAHFYFWTNLSRLRKKREKIPHLKVSQIYWGNVVMQHYLQRKKSFRQLDPGRFTGNPAGGSK